MPYLGNGLTKFTTADDLTVSGTSELKDNVTVTGDVTASGTLLPTGDTAAGDDAAIGFTSAEGLILTGQGSTSDITVKNDADATVFTVPTGTDDILFPDGAKCMFGASSDLQISHNGSYSLIADSGTGNLILACEDFSLTNPAVGENMITAAVDGAVTLYYDNAAKIATTSSGISVTGGVVASGGLSINSYGDPSNNYITLRPSFAPSASGGVGFAAKDHDGANNDGLGVFGHDGISFTTGGSERMRLTSAGSLGLGTLSPDALLQIEKSDSGTTINKEPSSQSGPNIAIHNSNQTANNLSSIQFTNRGTNGVAETATAGIHVKHEAQGGTYSYGSMNFNVTNSAGSYATRVTIDSNGNLLVGTIVPDIIGNGGDGFTYRPNAGVSVSRNTSGGTVIQTNRTANDGTHILFYRSASAGSPVPVGQITNHSTDFHVECASGGGTDAGIALQNNDRVNPVRNGALSDGTIDIGYSNYRWRNLYLSGGAYIGGTGSANYLEDYEEGTYTPAFTSTGASFSYSVQLGSYVKIGQLVCCWFNLTLTGSAPSGTTTNTLFFNVPFATIQVDLSLYSGGHIGHYFNINLGSGTTIAYQLPSASATQIELKEIGDNIGENGIVASELNASAVIRGSVMYRAAS